MTRRPLKFFISYARRDKAQVERLLDLLDPRLRIAAKFDFSTWLDRRIPVGAQWQQEIEAAMQSCDSGLLLLSPNFFASPYITAQELPHFIASGPMGAQVKKPVVPVGLKFIPLDGNAQLHGLEQLQIFRDSAGRWFNKTGGHISDQWADELVAAIIAKFTATGGTTP